MDALSLACELVAVPSVSTVSNAAASDIVQRALQEQGFSTERISYLDDNGVEKVNIVGKKGSGSGGLAYFAHTDVVPATTWASSAHGPFTPTVQGDRLYGRGSCDMKGSLAAFISAAARFPLSDLQRPVYVVATADEEIGYHGARNVVERSKFYADLVAGNAFGIIGEPTELEVVYAHKGGYGFRATSRGRAAHSSTREGVNANLAMIPFLVEMKAIHDETLSDPKWLNEEFEPPWVSWNIGVNDHTAAVNITPPQSLCTVAFRPMPGQDAEQLIHRAQQAADRCGIELDVTWRLPPVYTDPKSHFVQELCQLAGKPQPQTVSFGTDGSLFTAVKNLAVLGPGSIRQAHTDDEWLSLAELQLGTDLYARLIHRWCRA